MKLTRILVTVLAFVIAGSAFGFDGTRKGFVLGGGLGFAPYAHWSVDFGPFGDVSEEKAGAAAQIVIGGAFDEHNMLVYEVNIAAFNSDWSDESIGQGFNGGAWYHYFGPAGKTLFSTVGLGLYYFQVGDNDANDPGFGMLLGGGYEFARHWQVSLTASFGSTEEELTGLEFEHSNIVLMVTGIAF
jgi:hypothetical protein